MSSQTCRRRHRLMGATVLGCGNRAAPLAAGFGVGAPGNPRHRWLPLAVDRTAIDGPLVLALMRRRVLGLTCQVGRADVLFFIGVRSHGDGQSALSASGVEGTDRRWVASKPMLEVVDVIRRTRHRRWRVAVIALGLGPALAACGASVSCTAVGCVSVVSVDIASLATKARPSSATVTFCAAAACETQRVTFIADAHDTTLVQTMPTDPVPTAGTNVPVTLRVTQGTSVLLDTSTTATLTQYAPNGTTCGPICYNAHLVLTGQTLSPAPSGSASP